MTPEFWAILIVAAWVLCTNRILFRELREAHRDIRAMRYRMVKLHKLRRVRLRTIDPA